MALNFNSLASSFLSKATCRTLARKLRMKKTLLTVLCLLQEHRKEAIRTSPDLLFFLKRNCHQFHKKAAWKRKEGRQDKRCDIQKAPLPPAR